MILKKYRIHKRSNKLDEIIVRLDKIERVVKGLPEFDVLYTCYDSKGFWQGEYPLERCLEFAESWGWTYQKKNEAGV